MICNESNGEKSRDEKWTNRIQGMKIYNSEQIKKFLEDAGFTDVKVDKTKKGWICVVVKVMKKKEKRWYLLWFVGSLIWMTNFFDSFGKDGLDFWVSMQLLTAILFFCCRHCWVYFI